MELEPLICSDSLARLMSRFPVGRDRARACHATSLWKWKDITKAWITQIRAVSVPEVCSAPSHGALLLLVTAAAAAVVLWDRSSCSSSSSTVDVLEVDHASPRSLTAAWCLPGIPGEIQNKAIAQFRWGFTMKLQESCPYLTATS